MVEMGNEGKKETVFEGILVLCILSKALKKKILKNPLKYDIKCFSFMSYFSLIIFVPLKTFTFKLACK